MLWRGSATGLIKAGDLSFIIDAYRLGPDCAGKFDRGVSTMAILKALLIPATACLVLPDDRSKLVDGSYGGVDAAGRINRRVGTVAVKVTVSFAAGAVVDQIIANYLATVIDGQRLGRKSAGIIECCVSALAVEKAVIDTGSSISDSSDNLSSFVKV